MKNIATKNLDAKINTLKPSGSVIISRINNITVTAERSGDGKTLRFVRETPTATGYIIEVFKTTKF